MQRWKNARAGLCGQKLHKMNATLEKVKVFFSLRWMLPFEKVKVLCVTRLYVVRLMLRLKKWKFIFQFQSDTKVLRFGEGKQRSLWLLLILGDWGGGVFSFFLIYSKNLRWFGGGCIVQKKFICKHFLMIWSSSWGILAC